MKNAKENLAERICRNSYDGNLFGRISNVLSASDLANRTEKVLNKSEFKKHDEAREAARKIYEQAALHAAMMKEKSKKAKEAAILLLLLLAGEDAYAETHAVLSSPISFQEMVFPDLTIEQKAKDFAEIRQPVLKNFATKLAETIEQAQTEAAVNEMDIAETARTVRKAVKKASQTMAQTEAQVTYGSVQIDRLANAGYKTIIWVDMDDDRVRKSHRDCAAQGPVKIGQPFINGLKFPGDPNGPISETANCRCYLIGGTR